MPYQGVFIFLNLDLMKSHLEFRQVLLFPSFLFFLSSSLSSFLPLFLSFSLKLPLTGEWNAGWE